MLLFIVLIANAVGCIELKDEKPNANADTDLFGLYTTTLDGSNKKLLISNPKQEMTHSRVSPDKEWITFTRYNRKTLFSGGLATEDTGGYQDTEIMIMRLDGSGLETVIPHKKGIFATNSNWTPDGKSLIYVSTDNPGRKICIKKINLATRKITRVQTPEHLLCADPDQVGNRIVFPVPNMESGYNCLWIMNEDGTNAKQLTFTEDIRRQGKKDPIHMGDYDPKLSPDGSKVAFMRYYGDINWHVAVVDVESGEEKDISPSKTVDSVAEWSSDGKLLVFWHVDVKTLGNSGLYTMKPDGSERRRIPIIKGYFYRHPSFFPGEGSSGKSRIIFSAKKEPGMR